MAKTSESGGWDQDAPGGGRAGSTFVKRTSSLKQVIKTKIVRDDWDDDEDDEEEEQGERERERYVNGDTTATASGTRNDRPGPGLSGRGGREAEERKGEEDSNKIWEEANKRAPMPELIVARASTSPCFPPPPPAALQPTLRILKRPSPNTSTNNANAGAVSSTSLSSSSSGPTLGSGLGSGSGGTSPAPRGTLAEREAQYQEARSRIFGEKAKPGSTSGNVSSGGVVIVRDPLGPASEPELELGMSRHGPARPAKGFGERRRGKKSNCDGR